MSIDFEKVLWSTFDKLRGAGYQELNFADFVLILLLWKFTADKAEKIENTLEVAVKSSNPHLVLGQALTELRYNGVSAEYVNTLFKFDDIPIVSLRNILSEWKTYFDQFGKENRWSLDRVKSSFQVLESMLAKSYRKAHFFFTPPDIIKLISSTIKVTGEKSIYDPFCRSGDLLNKMIEASSVSIKARGDAGDPLSLRIAKARFLLQGFTSVSISFFPPVDLREKVDENKYDIIVTNPPFGTTDRVSESSVDYFSSTFKSNKQEVSFLTYVLDHLSDQGQAAIILPTGILFNAGVVEKLRAEIVQRNLLESVIFLPPKVFYGTGVSAAIWIFNRHKKSDKILLIDLSKKGLKGKDRYILKQESISEAVEIIQKFKANPDQVVEAYDRLLLLPPELKAHNYNLQIEIYQELRYPNEKYKRQSTKELSLECIKVEDRLSEIQKQLRALDKKSL